MTVFSLSYFWLNLRGKSSHCRRPYSPQGSNIETAVNRRITVIDQTLEIGVASRQAMAIALGAIIMLAFGPVSIHPAFADTTSEVVEFAIDGYEVTGPNPLSTRHTDSILSGYLGPARSLEDLRAATSKLEDAIRNKGYPFYRVIIPAQALDEGVVKLEVVAFPVNNIIISGGEFHSDHNVRRSLPALKQDESPRTRPLQRSLAVANLNPSKQTQVFFSVEPGTGLLEANISVQDQKTQNGLIWANDTGSKETGENRVGVAYQHNNLFDKDHTLTVSFGTSPQQTEDVQQYSLSYQVPLYAVGGLINLYAIRSDVNTGTVATFFDVSGRGDFIGGDFTYALPNVGRYKHFLVVGLDDKLFDNDIDFSGTPIGVDVRSRPVSLRHNGNWRQGRLSGSTNASVFFNLESGKFNNELSYTATRAAATPDWSAFRFAGSLRYSLGRWALSGRLSGQVTNDALIPGEQFGVGGLNSLRGINDRQLTGDRGFFASAEVESPPLAENAPRLLVFVDGGRVSNVDTLPGEVGTETVLSVGAGLRWSWKQRISISLDYGHVVDGSDALGVANIEDGHSRFHFQILGRI